jgi:hypothetical protein
MEMAVFLEDWISRIPEFGIDPELSPQTYCGVVMGVSQLGLVWQRQAC